MSSFGMRITAHHDELVNLVTFASTPAHTVVPPRHICEHAQCVRTRAPEKRADGVYGGGGQTARRLGVVDLTKRGARFAQRAQNRQRDSSDLLLKRQRR